ncbi:MAG: HD family phosphohydrolase [Thermodesulfobacteriota bacterium]
MNSNSFKKEEKERKIKWPKIFAPRVHKPIPLPFKDEKRETVKAWRKWLGILALLVAVMVFILPGRNLGHGILVALLLFVLFIFSRANIRKFQFRDKDLLFLTTLLVGMLIIARLSIEVFPFLGQALPEIPPGAYVYGIGLAAGGMLVRILLNSETALIFAAWISIFGGLLLDNNLFLAIYFFIGSVLGAHSVEYSENRGILLKAGAKVGIANAGMILAQNFISNQFNFYELSFSLLFGFLGGVVAGGVALGILPLLEWTFGYTTNIKLLELANLNHPLLKRMILEAPGTYHHSIVVSTMAEAAARAVNANPLLARVSAYYHDIGKISKPLYFVENQGYHQNKHDKLEPSLSSLILISHVKEGVELAREYKLGEKIQNIIQQHHGTSLISFFYQKAKDIEDPEMEQVNEEAYRYHGPKPQTKEAGLVLLADAVEAASRSLAHPTPARLQGLVQRIINNVFLDGQLDECELTLKDLHQIAKCFNTILTSIHHHRVEYPLTNLKEGNGKKRNNGDISKQLAKAGGLRFWKNKKSSEENLKRLGV